jgi:hypothetical protein
MVKDERKILEEQLRVMHDKLKEASAQMPGEDLVIEYDNGGGQSGIRENPFYSVYAKLLGSYEKTYALLNGDKKGMPADVTSLSEIRSKLKVAK